MSDSMIMFLLLRGFCCSDLRDHLSAVCISVGIRKEVKEIR